MTNLVKVNTKLRNKSNKKSEVPQSTINRRVYQDVFNRGQEYITINGKPMQYNADIGSYVPLSDDLLKRKIADFLDEDIPSQSKTANINSSLEFFIIKTYKGSPRNNIYIKSY